VEAAPCPGEVQSAWSNYQTGRSFVLESPFGDGGGSGFRDHDRGMRGASGGRGRRFSEFTRQPQIIDWQGEQIVPVRKDFSYPHPDVSGRTQEECDMLRLKHGIEVERSREDIPIPKPIVNLEETPFPDWATIVLRNKAWQAPTPIQIQAWPTATEGFDMIGIAATGSGKTMAYVLPMLVHIMAQPELKPGEGPVGLVLLPTRELCDQVRNEIAAFAEFTGLRCESVFGGEDFRHQALAFLERVDIVTATPGRLLDLLEKKKTNLKRVTYVVLDEADEMCERDFGSQVNLIMTQIRPDRQILLFSATWQDNMKEFAERVVQQRGTLSKGTIHINVGGIKLSACKDIDQQFWLSGEHGCLWENTMTKTQALCAALQQISAQLNAGEFKALIFCNRRETVPGIVAALCNADIACEGYMSSDAAQGSRSAEQLSRFRQTGSNLNVLVCTSLLGRGHDFTNVKYVLNYDMPGRLVEYIHRIGRTGRNGEKGFALTLLERLDLRFAAKLVTCLRDTAHVVPPFLSREARNSDRLWREYLRGGRPTRDRGGDAEEEPDVFAVSNPWKGRGRGRCQTFLDELNGRGLARAGLAA